MTSKCILLICMIKAKKTRLYNLNVLNYYNIKRWFFGWRLLTIGIHIWQVRGIPEPWVTWFKDGEPLLASDRHAVRRTDTGKCTLTIEDAAEEDAGRYSCEAVNDQGRVCTLTVVQVIANRRIVEAERRLQGWVQNDTIYINIIKFPSNQNSVRLMIFKNWYFY